MASESSINQKSQHILLRAIKTLPAQMLLHGSALLAVAAIGGTDLPGVLGTLATTVGVNVLSNMLERVAKGDEVTDDEIRTIVADAISSTGIDKLVTSNEFQRSIAHLFRQVDLLKYAVQRGEINIAAMLSQQFSQYEGMLGELKNEMGFVRESLSNLATHEQVEEINNSVNQISQQITQQNIFSKSHFPVEIVNREIENEIERIRKSRFFLEFDREGSSISFGMRLIAGDLSGGSNLHKSRALAWCARVLSSSNAMEKAKEYMENAKSLANTSEIQIANAFISSYGGDKNAALKILANLDSSSAHSAAFMIVAHHNGSEEAINWLETAGIRADVLDPDGKYFFLMQHLQLTQWEAAREFSDTLTDEDFREAPVLHHIKAITYLISAIPNELREIVISQVPIDAASFPLASDTAGLQFRRIAYRHFVDAVRVAEQLNCRRAAKIDEEYILWLELRDPEMAQAGREKLESKLRNPSSGLGMVHLGFQFGVPIDIDTVEREIKRQIVLHGGITREAAVARYALAFLKKTPEEAANYIAQHHGELIRFFDKKYLLLFQMDLFLQAGLLSQASECFDALQKDGLSTVEESRISARIAEAHGSDTVVSRKEQFNKTGNLGDLASLVDELEARKDWENISEYGQLLFERTRSLRDVERLMHALSQTRKSEQIIEFLRINREFLKQSKNLQLLYCWSLYYEGMLLEARSELLKLNDARHNPNYRALEINLAIALGDWDSLSAIVANEYIERDRRSAQELIAAAQLALNLDSPHAKALILEAVQKGSNDPAILVNAYFLASKAGWENDAEVFNWLEKAIALSGDSGPIQKMTLKDLLSGKPEWERRETEILQLLSAGEIPMFLAAQSLNKSLVYMMLFPALANSTETDPRRRILIPAYSGKRQPALLNRRRTVGIEATALLTLSFLNLVEKVFDAFDTVYIPHSTLTWLFEEKQKADFHQPSRIRDAHQLLYLLGTQAVEKLVPSTVPDSNLSAQVGEELALFIAEAEKARDNESRQCIVVRSSPVHHLGSLMDEEADLTSHEAVLSGCQSIVNKLRELGHITAEEEKKCRTYLQFQEKPWPNQPQITDQAILYLDDVTVTYFLHLGILDRLGRAGLKPIISPRKVSEANELVSYEGISTKVNEAIERIRSAIYPRIVLGKIKLGRQQNIEEADKHSIFEHPTVGVIAFAGECDAIISDDRCLNQHDHVSHGTKQSPIFTTLDVIDMLVTVNSITTEDQLEYKTRLRRSGYYLVPIRDDELSGCLSASMVKDNEVVETAELRAIRENILRVRMSTWLQLPKEMPWLDESLKAIIHAMRNLWKPNTDLSLVRTRSEWLLKQLDVRGWASFFDSEGGDNFIKTGRVAYILMLLVPLIDTPQEVKDEYGEWLENQILMSIKEQFPDLYHWIVTWFGNEVAKMANMDLTEGGRYGE
jgi:hypothetical protein